MSVTLVVLIMTWSTVQAEADSDDSLTITDFIDMLPEAIPTFSLQDKLSDDFGENYGSDGYGQFLGIQGAEVGPECAPEGAIAEMFSVVLAGQLGDEGEQLVARVNEILAATKALSEEEQQKIAYIALTSDTLLDGIQTTVELVRGLVLRLTYGQTLTQAFMQQPREIDNFNTVLKASIVEGSLMLLATDHPDLTDNMKQFFKSTAAIGNVVYYRLTKILEALEETRICGFFEMTCPFDNRDWKYAIGYAVDDDCLEYGELASYAKSMEAAQGLMAIANYPPKRTVASIVDDLIEEEEEEEVMAMLLDSDETEITSAEVVVAMIAASDDDDESDAAMLVALDADQDEEDEEVLEAIALMDDDSDED